MTNPNQPSHNPEALQAPSAHKETILFSDGQLAIGYRTPGDTLSLGPDSVQKYARRLHADGAAIVRTVTGNEYGINGGKILNGREQALMDLPNEPLEVTIGDSLSLPGVRTSAVESVLLKGMVYAPGAEVPADHRVEEPNPFTVLSERINELSSTQQIQ
jgi:hypothetical protein